MHQEARYDTERRAFWNYLNSYPEDSVRFIPFGLLDDDAIRTIDHGHGAAGIICFSVGGIARPWPLKQDGNLIISVMDKVDAVYPKYRVSETDVVGLLPCSHFKGCVASSGFQRVYHSRVYEIFLGHLWN
jgi:hypothetical protein